MIPFRPNMLQCKLSRRFGASKKFAGALRLE